MALRDHSLDDKITAAAFAEFSEKGYTGASLRKIAERAGVTVGAIQTRYKSKDELFVSLLRPFLDGVGELFQSLTGSASFSKAPARTIIPAPARIYWADSDSPCSESPRRYSALSLSITGRPRC